MDWFQALFLSIIQGITEFLPVSSSGHLVLGQALMEISLPGHEFEVMVHLGTFFSVLVVFNDDIIEINKTINTDKTRQEVSALVVGTIPAILAGFLLRDRIDIIFENVSFVGIALICTGIVLLISKRFSAGKTELSYLNGLLIGIAQAFAIIPGISRSGLTICTGLALGIPSHKAARFSFLLSLPVILGAGMLTAIEIDSFDSISWKVMLMGFFSSFLVGIFALKWLLNWLKSGQFFWFGFYCLLIGIITRIMA